jgi:hypothetical protein
MNITSLKKALVKSWNKNTCYPPMEKEWTEKNPAYGQCYVTALIVNDYFGGKILKAKFNNGTGHFWNLIEDKEIDLSKSQFDENEVIPKPKIYSREEIESKSKYEEYNRRYKILKKRVEQFLKNNS